jgi:hypothetical protein
MQEHQLCLFRRSYRVARGHSRINRRSLWAILFGLVFPVYCLAGEGKAISITVTADHTKANGERWDGIPGLDVGPGPKAIPIPNKNAPDLASALFA